MRPTIWQGSAWTRCLHPLQSPAAEPSVRYCAGRTPMQPNLSHGEDNLYPSLGLSPCRCLGKHHAFFHRRPLECCWQTAAGVLRVGLTHCLPPTHSLQWYHYPRKKQQKTISHYCTSFCNFLLDTFMTVVSSTCRSRQKKRQYLQCMADFQHPVPRPVHPFSGILHLAETHVIFLIWTN